LWAIVNVLSVFPNTTEIRNFYSSIMGSYLKRNKKEIRENVKTQKQKENWLNKNKVIELYKKNKDKLNKRDKMLMQLIIYFPRRLDWRLLKLHKSGKKDMNFNYLNVNKYGIPSSFQFFRSKSQGYEDTTKRIPSSVKNSLMTYIREMKNNTLLFPKENGEIHSADSFSKHIRKLFKIITDKDITMNTFRHIFATDLSDKNYSMNYREQKAQDSGHSLLKQMEYVKR
jgi:integrase